MSFFIEHPVGLGWGRLFQSWNLHARFIKFSLSILIFENGQRLTLALLKDIINFVYVRRHRFSLFANIDTRHLRSTVVLLFRLELDLGSYLKNKWKIHFSYQAKNKGKVDHQYAILNVLSNVKFSKQSQLIVDFN